MYVNKIVSDLQYYTRPKMLQDEKTNVGGGVHREGAVYTTQIPSRVEIRVELAQDSWDLHVDRGFLMRVFINLITNSL